MDHFQDQNDDAESCHSFHTAIDDFLESEKPHKSQFYVDPHIINEWENK